MTWARRGLEEGKSGPTGLEAFGGSVFLPDSPSNRTPEEKNGRRKSERTQMMRRLTPLGRGGGGCRGTTPRSRLSRGWGSFQVLVCKVDLTVIIYVSRQQVTRDSKSLKHGVGTGSQAHVQCQWQGPCVLARVQG